MPKPARKAIRAAAKKAAVADWERFTPHCMRHTFGSWEYERTGDAKYTQRVMRHADIGTTLRTYVQDRRDDAELVAQRPAVAPVAPKLQVVK